MKKSVFFHFELICIVALFALFMGACGPAATEAPAATTAPPAPPTETPPPPPTPTPTPLPYDLTLTVTNADSEPIPGAAIRIAEQENLADESGMAVFAGLPDSAVAYTVVAQGYFPAEGSATIERGENQIQVSMERDPFGLLPEHACGPGETLLYSEDFQDGQAQGWDVIEMQVPGWSIEPFPDEADDMVVAAERAPLGRSWATRIATPSITLSGV